MKGTNSQLLFCLLKVIFHNVSRSLSWSLRLALSDTLFPLTHIAGPTRLPRCKSISWARQAVTFSGHTRRLRPVSLSIQLHSLCCQQVAHNFAKKKNVKRKRILRQLDTSLLDKLYVYIDTWRSTCQPSSLATFITQECLSADVSHYLHRQTVSRSAVKAASLLHTACGHQSATAVALEEQQEQ